MSGRGVAFAIALLAGLYGSMPAVAQHVGPGVAVRQGIRAMPPESRPHWNDMAGREDAGSYRGARCQRGGDSLLGAIAGGLIGNGASPRSERTPVSAPGRGLDRDC